jgi:mono/diheme cytochrome c family protein
VLPDLRRSAALNDKELWHNILITGILKDAGMVSFKEYLTADQVEAIRAYVAQKARAAQQIEHGER